MYQNAGDCKVYYLQAGSGKPLLFLHGWGVSGDIFKPLFFHFAEKREVRVIDFPGFGQSAPPPAQWGTVEYAVMVAELLEAWGWEKADIIAHSFGARVALRLAHSHPQRVGKMILTGAAGIRRRGNVPTSKRMLSRIGKSAGSLGAPGRWLKELIYRAIGSADYLRAGEMRNILVKVVNEDLSPLLPHILHETLLVWGEKDTATPLEDGRKMKNLLPDATLEVVPDAGHYAFTEKAEYFLETADRFLNR